MANGNIPKQDINIYATIRDDEREPLRALFKLAEPVFENGLVEGWIKPDDHAQFHTYLKPARELQKEALSRIIPLISKIFGNGRYRIDPNNYVSLCWLLGELSSFTRNELSLERNYKYYKI